MIILHCYCYSIDPETNERVGDIECLPIELDETCIESKQPTLKERKIIQNMTIIETKSGSSHYVEETVEEINALVEAAKEKICDHELVAGVITGGGNEERSFRMCEKCAFIQWL